MKYLNAIKKYRIVLLVLIMGFKAFANREIDTDDTFDLILRMQGSEPLHVRILRHKDGPYEGYPELVYINNMNVGFDAGLPDRIGNNGATTGYVRVGPLFFNFARKLAIYGASERGTSEDFAIPFHGDYNVYNFKEQIDYFNPYTKIQSLLPASFTKIVSDFKLTDENLGAGTIPNGVFSSLNMMLDLTDAQLGIILRSEPKLLSAYMIEKFDWMGVDFENLGNIGIPYIRKIHDYIFNSRRTDFNRAQQVLRVLSSARNIGKRNSPHRLLFNLILANAVELGQKNLGGYAEVKVFIEQISRMFANSNLLSLQGRVDLLNAVPRSSRPNIEALIYVFEKKKKIKTDINGDIKIRINIDKKVLKNKCDKVFLSAGS